MDPIAGNTQNDNKVPPLNNIIVPSDRRQDENVGTGNMSLPLSRQDIPEIVAAVMAAAFPKARVLPNVNMSPPNQCLPTSNW